MVKYNEILRRISRRRKPKVVFVQDRAMTHKANFSTSLKIFDTLHCMQLYNSYYKTSNLHIQNIYNETISTPTCSGD